MGKKVKIQIVIEEETLTTFRMKVGQKFGAKKGAISEAFSQAIKEWVKKT